MRQRHFRTLRSNSANLKTSDALLEQTQALISSARTMVSLTRRSLLQLALNLRPVCASPPAHRYRVPDAEHFCLQSFPTRSRYTRPGTTARCRTTSFQSVSTKNTDLLVLESESFELASSQRQAG